MTVDPGPGANAFPLAWVRALAIVTFGLILSVVHPGASAQSVPDVVRGTIEPATPRPAGDQYRKRALSLRFLKESRRGSPVR